MAPGDGYFVTRIAPITVNHCASRVVEVWETYQILIVEEAWRHTNAAFPLFGVNKEHHLYPP